jgi:hypothetical protein
MSSQLTKRVNLSSIKSDAIIPQARQHVNFADRTVGGVSVKVTNRRENVSYTCVYNELSLWQLGVDQEEDKIMNEQQHARVIKAADTVNTIAQHPLAPAMLDNLRQHLTTLGVLTDALERDMKEGVVPLRPATAGV